MTVPNTKLGAILDAEADADNEQSMLVSQQQENSADAAVTEEALHAEIVKRTAAEADAENKTRQLAVAQTQFSEYLADKAAEEENMFKQASNLELSLRQAAGNDGGAEREALAAVLAEIGRLREGLAAAAADAKTTAQQVAAESERLSKRSSSQADLGNGHHGGTSNEKRQREGENGAAGSGSGADTGAVADRDGEPEEADMEDAADLDDGEGTTNGNAAATAAIDEDAKLFAERAKYVPLRLTQEERRILRLLEGALNVSEYTDKVDILSFRNKTGRITAQIKDLCAILCGLTVAQDFKRGQKLIADRNFDQLKEFFQNCFEIGRRFKTMNPEKMRDTYGKLVYMLMDSVDGEVAELLGFDCVRPLRTVHSLLQEGGALGLLTDPLLPVATAEIASRDRSRNDVQRDIRKKEKARESLSRKYRSRNMSEEDLLWAMYSISDHHSYLTFARDPVDRIIDYLKYYFRPDAIEPGYSLAIQGGAGGARLTHSHERQYTFVLQSLTLWREIAHDMFRLWTLAENDMLSETNGYRLQNTGQGLQRVQSAPRVAKAMSGILSRCQRRLGSWIGSSVVHLGDQAVPNALIFIDKYTQVPRILNPLVLVLDELPRLAKDPKVAAYLDDAFGGWEECRKSILVDFFQHAFDGSGADSFYMAGSCIDGRLTSAWNWGSKIEKKAYWPVFKLAGFNGFDGDFKG